MFGGVINGFPTIFSVIKAIINDVCDDNGCPIVSILSLIHFSL
jgi:hypothetical protein